MTDPRAVGKAAIVMVVLVIVWGYAWILSKMALAYCAPLDFATIRIALATVALLPALLWSGRPRERRADGFAPCLSRTAGRGSHGT